MTTVMGDPGAMRGYLDAVRLAREDASGGVSSLETAFADLEAALPPGFSLAGLPDVAGALSNVQTVDDHVGTIADRFEQAGTLNEDGTYSIDDAVLTSIPYVSVYTESERERLRQRAETELARLRENMGSSDETTLGEMIAVLGWMREEVDSAVRPRIVAEDLIDRMGSGDVRAMLDMLEGALGDGANVDVVRRTIEDLSVVVSQGLEEDPERASRWVDEMYQHHDWRNLGPPDMLVALGAMTAPGTDALGLSVFRKVWGHVYSEDGSVYTEQHRTAQGGALDQLFGTRSPIEVLAESAGAMDENGAAVRPQLAESIVRDVVGQGPEAFAYLFGEGGVQDTTIMTDDAYDALGQMLTASVDPTLQVDNRIQTAGMTLDAYVQATEIGYDFPDPVNEGLGTTTQPLLENVVISDDKGVIRLPGNDATDRDNPTTEVLQEALRTLSDSDGGLRGIATAVEGATADLILHQSLDLADGSAPLREDSLKQTGDMWDLVVGTISEERLDALEDAVEGGGPMAGGLTALAGAAGSVVPDPAMIIFDTVNATLGDDVLSEGHNPLGANAEGRMTYYLVLANLEANPDLASPELLEGLQRAIEDRGVAGISLFLKDSSIDEADYPGLTQLEDLIQEQEGLVDANAAALLSRVFLGTD